MPFDTNMFAVDTKQLGMVSQQLTGKTGWLCVFAATIVTVGVVVVMETCCVSRFESPVMQMAAPLLGFDLQDDSKYISNMCQERFNDTLEDNLKVIENYPQGIADQYLWKIGTNKSAPDKMEQFPVIVTAMDKSYYPFSQGMFATLHMYLMKHYNGTVNMIVYDLGLTRRQLKMLRNKCRCELRRFPFEDFPPHVRTLRTYAFKPIIVQKLLMEFGFVWWVDSSVKFIKRDVDFAVDYVKNNGLLVFVSTDSIKDSSIARHTDIRTFQFLGEDICKFRAFGETWATTALFHYDKISRVIAKAWASCALNENCIAPLGTQDKLSCDKNISADGQCHRFDQSVLSILTRRVFHERNIYPFDDKLRKIFFIYRQEFVDYFERCRYEITCY